MKPLCHVPQWAIRELSKPHQTIADIHLPVIPCIADTPKLPWHQLVFYDDLSICEITTHEPSAFSYELATTLTKDRQYTGWIS